MEVFENLPHDKVQQNLEIMKQFVEFDHPEIDTNRGFFHDAVLYYSAIFETKAQLDIQAAKNSLNLSDLISNPDSAKSEDIDKLASNWLVKRNEGKKASGEIVLLFKKPVVLVLPKNTKFTDGRVEFTTTETYSIRLSSGGVIHATDRILEEIDQGYIATILIISVEAGEKGNLRENTHLRPVNLKIPQLLDISTSTNFINGRDIETNKSLINRLAYGPAIRTWSNDYTIKAQILDKLETIPRGISIVGRGHPIMARDKLDDLVSLGGCVDIYISTSESLNKLQEHFNSSINTPTTTNIMIKVPYVCDIKLNIEIIYDKSQAKPYINTIPYILSKHINSTGFEGRLKYYDLVKVIESVIGNNYHISLIEMSGSIEKLSFNLTSSSYMLEIPNKPDKLVHPDCVVFNLKPEDVDISVKLN